MFKIGGASSFDRNENIKHKINGNPSSHEPDKATQRMAFNGYCLVLIQSNGQTGEIRLKASAEKLKGVEVVIKAEGN